MCNLLTPKKPYMIIRVIILYICIVFINIVSSKDKFLYFAGCEVGYFGNNCTDPCRYPSFGYRCQKECNCTQDICDHKTGCSLPQSTIK